MERPEFIETLSFPENLPSLDAAVISDYHAKYTLLFTYSNQELAQADVAILKLNRKRQQRENAIFRSRPHLSSVEKWKREAVFNEDHNIEIIEQELMMGRVRKRTLEAFKENYERLIAALSRELTRKQAYLGRTESF